MGGCGSRVKTGPKKAPSKLRICVKAARLLAKAREARFALRAKHGPSARLTLTLLLTPTWRPANTVKIQITLKKPKVKPDGRTSQVARSGLGSD